MFTGIIEAVGSINSIRQYGDDFRVEVATGELDLSDVNLGDSIATNGVCLTVVAFNENTFEADVSVETINKTGFAHYSAGQTVNLEKALLPTTRLGGHIVSGHVDGVAKVEKIQNLGRAVEYWLSAPSHLTKYIVEKGSITIDGISLTVNDVEQTQFKLTIVPHTAQETTISQLKVGSLVNLEIDVMARYVEKLLTHKEQSSTEHNKDNVTMDLLSRSGFLK
ncbi:riboflavin synthase [Flocculibacter collagenilyticus]|uniref:riboflavin synthase n=1 Tax=Flocculibacter collagenilyticus TaxID=2744479 RepID=UPI0018F7859B|nr:riboflavin synthase [Flocculibacter collagenilyticus]